MEESEQVRSKQETLEILPGVALLLAKRGGEQVAFSQVADHLVDFATRHRDEASTIDSLGAFLAAVEDTPHEHGQPAGSAGV